ncbi:pyridoxal phosphate-dependent aminotransferase [Rarobacter faecitabidus]|uniref:cysteine-S-conjugate beta-lyase n=1 Tax=Rarobacter faecitabidus TaxID=13243 RepID=A0A542ZP70_RARFA|nr:aminotransferase class I/II-fold pyridoxal phosphate-dependent enzyme [Rarobacter faecitabidus]TQL62155.1 cystathionine beta-lyase [Rarobacter faecitabidus]
MSDPLVVPERVLRSRTSAKWQQFEPDVLPLWVAEMDCDLAPGVAAAIHAVIDRGDTGYAAGETLQNAHRAFAAQTWGWEPEGAELVPNVMLGVVSLLRTLLRPGAPVFTANPIYPPLVEYPRAAGFDVRQLADGIEELDAQWQKLTGDFPRAAYLLCNPQNPTGQVHSAAELEALGEVARRHGVVIIVDEIHAPLSYVPFTPVIPQIPEAFALQSASKAFNLVGLNVALLLRGPQAPPVRRAPELISAVSHVAEIAHSAAYGQTQWLADLLAALRVRREIVARFLARELPQVGFATPDATYLAWLDFSAMTTASGEPVTARRLVAEAKVALSSGRPFGRPGFLRLNFATSEEILLEALERIAAAVR